MSRLEHRIFVGDCLDPVTGLASLADKSVDCVLTDPPYDEHTHTKSVRGQGHKPGGKIVDLGFAPMTLETMSDVAEHLARVARRWVGVFCSVEHAMEWRGVLSGHGLDYIRTGAWVKECPSPQFTGDRPAVGFEALVLAHRPGRKIWNGGGKAGIWSAPTAYRNGDEMHHTTQKPVSLMESLVRDFTDPGETVLDPFAGSGTTGVACKRLGRGFLGWELNPKYAAIAQKRIDGTREQLGLAGIGA